MSTEIDRILESFPFGQRDYLIPMLERIQEETGQISEEAVIKVGKYLKLPVSKVHGVASFYDEFSFNPKPATSCKVCCGTTCHLHGSAKILKDLEAELKIKPGQVTRDNAFSLKEATCMGACSLAPVISLNTVFYSIQSKQQLISIINKCKKQKAQ